MRHLFFIGAETLMWGRENMLCGRGLKNQEYAGGSRNKQGGASSQFGSRN